MIMNLLAFPSQLVIVWMLVISYGFFLYSYLSHSLHYLYLRWALEPMDKQFPLQGVK